MGEFNREPLGFPNGQIKGTDWSYYPGSGGLGAGACFLPAGFSYIYWPVKVNPFSVRNNRLVLKDEDFFPYTNAGFDGICANSNGSKMPFDVYTLVAAPTSGLDTSLAKGRVSVLSTQTLPFEVEFLAAQLPQPSDAGYAGRIWIAVDIKQTGLMIGAYTQTSELMKTTNLEWEGQP